MLNQESGACYMIIKLCVISSCLCFLQVFSHRLATVVPLQTWYQSNCAGLCHGMFPVVPVTLQFLSSLDTGTFFLIFFILPFPVLVFSLVGTIKSLSSVISVSSEEKQRVVRALVLVLCTYTVLFLPLIILIIAIIKRDPIDTPLFVVTSIFILINPLADMLMYVFMAKGAMKRLLAFLCCCKKNRSVDTAGR